MFIKKYIASKNLSSNKNRKKVGKFILIISILLLLLFIFRLIYIVTTDNISGNSLSKKIKKLYTGSKIIFSKRGNILDRYGNIIATDSIKYSIYVILSKKFIDNFGNKLYLKKNQINLFIEIISKYINIEKNKVLKILKLELKRKKKFQIEIGNECENISFEKKQLLEKEFKKNGINCVGFKKHICRKYLNGKFSSHFIGYVKNYNFYDNIIKKKIEKNIGLLGIEKLYNKLLTGKNGFIIYKKDVNGNIIPDDKIYIKKKVIDGKDIYTTLDIFLQLKMEELLDFVYFNYKPENITATLINAKNGEILALSQRPTFNPNNIEKNIDKNFLWRNILIEDKFEPGSIMKPFLVLAALEEKVFDENFFYKSGQIKVEDRIIKDFDYNIRCRYLNFKQALSWSSNVGMVYLYKNLDSEKWLNYLKKFGFGSNTKTGFINESSGNLPTNNIVDLTMSTFGQAIAVTNFQILQAYTTICNDGKMLKLKYIKKIYDKYNKKNYNIKTKILKKNVISINNAKKIRNFMIDTIKSKDYGSAYNMKLEIPDYNIAVKTGTAQINNERGKYISEQFGYIYSIIELIPAEKPDFIIYITIKKPKYYDPIIFSKISNPLLKLALNIKECNKKINFYNNENFVVLKKYVNMPIDIVINDLKNNHLIPIVIGNGKIVKKQFLNEKSLILKGSKFFILTDGDIVMPNLIGFSKNDVLQLFKFLNINIKIFGNDYVKKQNIKIGEKILNKKNFVIMTDYI